MKRLDIGSTKESLVDVSAHLAHVVDGKLVPADGSLAARIAKLVTGRHGFAVCHGVSKVLASNGLDVAAAGGATAARDYLEDVFRSAAGLIDVAKFSPVDRPYDHIAKMDVDGYNKNTSFTPNSDHTASREFVTTKCVHFDAATPFIANIYGPTENIAGGLPMICDTRRFCADHGVDPRGLVENIPNNYNVAVKSEYTQAILEDYSVALELDLQHDLVMIVLFNEVVGGVAHASTQPVASDPAKPSRRPIRHIEYQFGSADDLGAWYDYYDLTLTKATDHKDDPEHVRRYNLGEQSAYGNVLTVAG
jgi:hypothetical protein